MRRNFAIATFVAMLPFGAVAQPLVQSQEGIALENQILQLQNQVQQLQSGGSGGSALGGSPQAGTPTSGSPASGTTSPANDIVGNLLNQVSQLQAQVQQLNGRVDTLQNEVDTQHAATEKEIGDLNFKVTGGGGDIPSNPDVPVSPGSPTPGNPQNVTDNTPGASLGGQASTVSPPLPPVQSDTPSPPKAMIEAAQTALARRDYVTAESNARAVLATAKSGTNGYKAQFILAEALYGEGKPEDAAIAYDDAYNHNRSGVYAAGSLLGLANSLTDIQQQSAACDTLSSLNSQFPTPPPGMGPRIQSAEERAKCN